MDQRAKIAPGIPESHPTVSYWQDPPDPIANLRSTDTLPAESDFVIIGSGISGSCIAYNLLLRRPDAKVLMLEARTACSGATGRNGGHTKAASYRSFPRHAAELGVEEAVKIARLEYANIRATHEFAQQHGIQCDSRPCKTMDIIFDHQELEDGKKAISMIQAAMGSSDGAADYTVYGADEARQRFLVPEALGAFEYDAGSVHAYRFTVGILKMALQLRLNLQTNMPVLGLKTLSSDQDHKLGWEVETSQGTIHARNVILATNGFTAQLHSPLLGSIVPLRGQVSAQRPGIALPLLPTTYSFIYTGGYEYMIQSPSTKSIVIGGGLGKLAAAEPTAYLEEFGQTNDRETNAWISRYLTDCTATCFEENWGSDDKAGRVQKEWTGIMGTSADGLPLVGPLPDEEGLWISFACNGHGMVLCLKCAEALTCMLLGEEDQCRDWFPETFKITKERMGKTYTGRI
ncbi:MAG: hypothetical protein M1821_005439 [Bathelium mastoideum]|nr:MAG: hypothetical protein M1821_005439 [Bathelium mastoideum]